MANYDYFTTAQMVFDGTNFARTEFNESSTGSIDAGDDFLTDGEVLLEGTFAGTYTGLDGTIWLAFEVNSSPLTYNLFTSEPLTGNPNDFLPREIPTLPFNTASFQVCFGAGTLIATPEGETRVEDLAIGAVIRTATGGTTTVKWVGRQTLSKVFSPAERFAPVRISAGALGNGLPLRDLVLTGDHALSLDGLLVQASAMVNGTTITRVPMAELADQVTYYHVETENHDLLLAEGAPAETYVDNVTRRAFDNYAEFEALYGAPLELIAELETPRVLSPRQLPAALRAQLGVARAA